MKNNIRILKDKFDDISWGYFKKFQKKMHARERISAEVVNRYEDSIYFMVDTDRCLMEAIIPRKTWVDTSTKRFGTYKEKLLKYTLNCSNW